MNFASRRVKHITPVVVMAANDVVAILFACAAAVVSRGSGAAAAVALSPPLDGDCLLVVLSAALGWLGLMGNVKGYQSVSVAAVATIAGSSSIPFNYGYQVLVFRRVPDALSVAGAVVVVMVTVGTTVVRHLAARSGAAAGGGAPA